MEKAKELSQKFIITDGHIDTPWRMHKWGYEDISKRSPGDFDYVRAKEGGLDVPFMAIYVPATYQVTGGAKEKAEETEEQEEEDHSGDTNDPFPQESTE